jgi:hypothetical protein
MIRSPTPISTVSVTAAGSPPRRLGDASRRTEIGRSPLEGEGGRLQDPRRRTLRSGAQGRAVEVRGTVSENLHEP